MNRLLIDTNIMVYLFNNMLDEDVETMMRDYNTQVYVSSVSVMEFEHLLQNNRIRSKNFKDINVVSLIEDTFGFRILYTNREHLLQLQTLPIVEGHNDPNDRLIISQAICERLELVSSDSLFKHYRRYGLNFISAKKHN